MLNMTGSVAAQVKRLPLYEVRSEMSNLYLPEEELLFAFVCNETRYLLTSRRIIAVEKQDGGNLSFTFLPHSRLQFYAIDASGITSHADKAQLCLLYTNGFALELIFSDGVDLDAIQSLLAQQLM